MTFNTVYGMKLTKQQKKGSLHAFIFLKQNGSGKVKGRACSDGQKQREASKKSDATSPVIATEAVLIIAAVDSMEGRDVTLFNAPGIFLTSNMDKDILLVPKGPLAKFM